MKKIIVAILLLPSTMGFSQALGYGDLGILFSSDNHNGTARFTSMGGAFGALGGDISSLTINPAGLSVFNNTTFSIALNNRNSVISSNYYNTINSSENDYFNISTAGGVLIYDNLNSNDWSKLSIGFNYRIKSDFDSFFTASGNSGFASFNTFPRDTNDPVILYNNGEEQIFDNLFDGDIREFNFAISALHKEKFHFGFGINMYNLRFQQSSVLSETNNDGNGNILYADFYQDRFTNSSGFSISAGMIYKASENIRFGLSYFSPTWFTDVVEESNILNNDGYFGDTIIEVTNSNLIYDNTSIFAPIQSLVYSLRTPSQFTASTAIIFGKIGLLSVDYSIKNYSGMNLTGANFIEENRFFSNELRNAETLNIGGEIRLGQLSLRGGYIYEQNPDRLASKSNNLKRYSGGIGYRFGNIRIDLAYTDSNRIGFYNFYSQYPQIDAAELDFNNKIFTTSITVSL